MPPLQIELLGNFHLSYHGELVTSLHQTRTQSLLAYLFLHLRTQHTRRHVASLFWPNSSEDQALTNLRKQLHHLRYALPESDHLLYTDAKTVQWRPSIDFALDVHQFDQALSRAAALEGDAAITVLQESIALYQGDLLPACYDEWIGPIREELRARYTEALERLVLLLEDRRDYPQAIAIAQRLLRHDPLHEASYRRLMRLHAIVGNRAAALDIYHTCIRTLQKELNVTPNLETYAAYEQLIQHEIPVALSRRRTLAVPLFVGRQAEWQRIQETWREATRGRAQVLLISGQAGIGKTRLAEELLEWATNQGIISARARVYAAEGSLAYAPVIEWLRTPALMAQLAQLDDIWRAELGRLLPELLTDYPDLSQTHLETESWQRHRLFEALARGALIGKSPLLLVLDDMQWSDQETLEWLHFLLRYDPRASLLVVATVRTEELGAEALLTPWLWNMRHRELITEIKLAPLSESDTFTLVGHLANMDVETEIAAQIYKETEGNPLFVVETMRAISAEQSKQTEQTVGNQFSMSHLSARLPKVHAVIQTRLAQLSTDARKVARLAAAIGREFTLAVLVEAGDRDEETLVQELDELWQRQIVREQSVDTYDFSHDKIREALYAELSPMRRRLLHHRIAQSLEQIHTHTIDPVSGQIAAHYERAGLPEQAIPYYRRAAEAARNMYAYHETIHYLERGLELMTSLPDDSARIQQELEMQVDLAAALMATQGWASVEAEQAYLRAWDLCRQVETTPHLFPIVWGLHEIYLFQTKYDQAREMAKQCMTQAQQTQTPDLLLQAHHAYWGVFFLLSFDELDLALQHADQGIAFYHPQRHHAHTFHYGGHDPGLCAYQIAAKALWLLGYPDQALQRGREGLLLGQQLSHPSSHAFILVNIATVHVYRREIELVAELSERALAIAIERNNAQHAAESTILYGWAQAMQGDVTEGIVQMRQGIAEWQALGIVLQRPYFLALLAEAFAKAGQFRAALSAVDEALDLVRSSGERYLEAELHRLRGQMRLYADDSEEGAERAFLQAIEVARLQHTKSLELRSSVSLGRLWRKQGKHDLAYRLLAEIYDWFGEGHETVDLQEAQTLLSNLI